MATLRRRAISLALVFVVLSAGCVTTISLDTGTPTSSQTGEEWTVTVTRVVDGDTVEARFPNGETDTLRLLGVDTPETTMSRVTPEEFEGVPDTDAGRDHLYKWGERARQYTERKLAGQTVRVAVDPTADRRGDFGRLLVYVYLDGDTLNQQLIEHGYARVYETHFSRRDAFDATEAKAQANEEGVWGFDEGEERGFDGEGS